MSIQINTDKDYVWDEDTPYLWTLWRSVYLWSISQTTFSEDKNPLDEIENTPLHYAARHVHLNIIK